MSAAQPTLFSHLIQRFREPPEVLATEALGFILNRSTACRRAVRDLAHACGASVVETLVYRTQIVDEEGARPDVVGSPPGESPQVVLEGKFWAGLTERQPRGYIAELDAARPGILLVVAPAARIATLWPELRELSVPDGIAEADSTSEEDLVAAQLTHGHIIGLVSWRLLLSRLAVAAEAAHENSVRQDIAQLQSLCDAQDRQAFLPLRRDEVTDQEMPQRLVGYYQLLGDIATKAINDDLAWKGNLRPSGGGPRYGQFLFVGEYGTLLAIDFNLWSEYGFGPFWLWFRNWWWPAGSPKDDQNAPYAEIAKRLSPLDPGARASTGRGPALIVLPSGQPVVALPLPVGVERHEVIEVVVGHLRRVFDLLGGIPYPGPRGKATITTPEPDSEDSTNALEPTAG
jgi:hypothetical protein